MKLIKAETWARRYFGDEDRPDLHTVRGWVRDGYVPGLLGDGKGLVDEESFLESCGSRYWVPRLYRSSRKNADRRGIPFLITERHLHHLAERSGGRCKVTGIPFDFSRVKESFRRPWVPSLDRINGRKGYRPGNCRLVCSAVNIAMNNEWGEGVLRKIAYALVAAGEDNAA
ncbi:MAG: hypothetical protein J5I81_07835 [Nitrococcus mobilis]|nr:hypothetical protein [Nitrococcus mobilis]